MVDFKETAKEIFDICTNIAKSDGRATEKVEDILKRVYESGFSKGGAKGYQDGWSDGTNWDY